MSDRPLLPWVKASGCSVVQAGTGTIDARLVVKSEKKTIVRVETIRSVLEERENVDGDTDWYVIDRQIVPVTPEQVKAMTAAMENLPRDPDACPRCGGMGVILSPWTNTRAYVNCPVCRRSP